jgi:hypothetical protein
MFHSELSSSKTVCSFQVDKREVKPGYRGLFQETENPPYRPFLFSTTVALKAVKSA